MVGHRQLMCTGLNLCLSPHRCPGFRPFLSGPLPRHCPPQITLLPPEVPAPLPTSPAIHSQGQALFLEQKGKHKMEALDNMTS